MSASLLHHVLPPQPDAREIDDHYHLMVIAESAGQVAAWHEERLCVQQEAAREQIHALERVAAGQEQAADDRARTHELLAAMKASLLDLDARHERLIEVANEQRALLQQGFAQLGEHLLRQRHALAELLDVLSRPYETQARELLGEAQRALAAGMRAPAGRARQAELADARRLLTSVLDNPIGNRNAVAWFQLGWLHWRHDEDPSAAEDAFFNAGRLAGEAGGSLRAMSLRHQAHVQAQRGDPEGAYASAVESARLVRSAETLYDLARYAARSGRQAQALALLDECIDLRPSTIVEMLRDEDFVG